jgi:hypothetical protein
MAPPQMIQSRQS